MVTSLKAEALDRWHRQFGLEDACESQEDASEPTSTPEVGEESYPGNESDPWIEERPDGLVTDDFSVLLNESGEVIGHKKGSSVAPLFAPEDGRWRLLVPGPTLMIFGRTSQAPAQDASGRPSSVPPPSVALAGEISASGGLSDVIAFIHQSRWSGRFHAVDGTLHRAINFLGGEVKSCDSNIPGDRLGELLFRFGYISRADLDRALELVGPKRKIGQALIDLGLVTTHDVFTGVRRQAEEIFFAVLRMQQGTYCFERSETDPGVASLASISTQSLLLEGVRRADEMAYFRQKIPASSVVCARRRGPVTSNASLTPELGTVLTLVDGVRTVADIARQSHLGEFEATRALHELLNLGYLEIPQESLFGVSESGREPGHLIDVFNQFLAGIHGTLVAARLEHELYANLLSFVHGGSPFAPLFKNTAPGPDGKLSTELILANLTQLDVKKKVDFLEEGLSELLKFFFFCIGDSIGHKGERALGRLTMAPPVFPIHVAPVVADEPWSELTGGYDETEEPTHSDLEVELAADSPTVVRPLLLTTRRRALM